MTRYGDLKGDNVTEEPAPLDGKATDGEHEAGSSGGPYRAFLRYKKLKSNTESSRLYRQFQRDQPDEFAELQRQGQEATERARNGESAFGGSMQQLSVTNSKRVALAHLQRFQALEDDERTDAIICDLLSSGVAVDVGVKTLRRIERMVSDGKRSQEAEEAALVKEHIERNTPSEVGSFLDDLAYPMNAHLAAALQSSPPPMLGAVCLRVNNNIAANAATALHTYVKEAKQNQTNVGIECERLWERITAIVDDCDEDDDVGADENKHDLRCYLAGHCITHTAAGRELYKIRNKFFRILKLAYPSRIVDRRSVLEGGRVIARISLSMKATPGEDVDMDALMDLDLSTVYASIPDLSFSPYAPMFTAYCEADAHDREAANAADDELALKAQM